MFLNFELCYNEQRLREAQARPGRPSSAPSAASPGSGSPARLASLLGNFRTEHSHGPHHRRRLPEDIPNRFQLTLAATYRARQIAAGATPLLETNKDKPTVIALREIAAARSARSAQAPAPTPPVS